ncbi:hypothetical protein C8R21_12217 [Nitrosospira multiformis]|uniref:Uncharacterized protein n=1 Tax=Nitrosospira multiformis TaxID=1231 RepID=A0A2T5I7K9_9PROT|nr:hypothetical protein C8R21_12217 [Nitrosospira multiformis]
MSLSRWIDEGLPRYYDKEKGLALVDRSGLYMTGLSQARSPKEKIYQESDLVKYRKDRLWRLDLQLLSVWKTRPRQVRLQKKASRIRPKRSDAAFHTWGSIPNALAQIQLDVCIG